MLSLKIQTFLNQKLDESNLSKMRLAEKAGLTYSVIFDLAKGYKTNPKLKTLQKLADVFQCSIDEVCGRDPAYYSDNIKFTPVSDEQAMLNLKIFVNQKIIDNNISAHKLGRLAGFSTMAIASFVGNNSSKKSLGSLITVGIADYFKVSIDEMIGRKHHLSKEKVLNVDKIELAKSYEKIILPSLQNISIEDRNTIRSIKKELASLNNKTSDTTYNAQSVNFIKPNKPRTK